ncbi:MAG: hypothetical protein E6R07_02240 [Nevskiaceae bacterium]|nr:MAG: hypothetical protein E6R07_02240 [Nevskiaceae bacterium]
MKPSVRITTFVLLLVTALLGACASPETRIRDNPEGYARLTPAQQALVHNGDIGIGMPDFGVEMALGRPDSITERTEAKGVVRVWHYKNRDSTVATVDYVGYYNPYFFPAFAPVVINNAQPAGDRIRVFFDDRRVVVAIEREVSK